MISTFYQLCCSGDRDCLFVAGVLSGLFMIGQIMFLAESFGADELTKLTALTKVNGWLALRIFGIKCLWAFPTSLVLLVGWIFFYPFSLLSRCCTTHIKNRTAVMLQREVDRIIREKNRDGIRQAPMTTNVSSNLSTTN